MDWLGLNFYAINLKFLQSVDNYMAYTLWKFRIDSLQIVILTNLFLSQKYFRILDQLGLNVYAINLKFLQCTFVDFKGFCVSSSIPASAPVIK